MGEILFHDKISSSICEFSQQVMHALSDIKSKSNFHKTNKILVTNDKCSKQYITDYTTQHHDSTTYSLLIRKQALVKQSNSNVIYVFSSYVFEITAKKHHD